jgi:hypothetical protein
LSWASPEQPGLVSDEVLLDRTRIEAGDDWAELLHDVLAECQGAVLLLSQRALDRPLGAQRGHHSLIPQGT